MEEEQGGIGKMIVKIFYGFLIFFIMSMFFFWAYFLNVPEMNFSYGGNTNFVLNESVQKQVQFYPNMRFSDSKITYSVSEDCPIKRKNDILDATNFLSNNTVLSFIKQDSNGRIIFSCSDKTEYTGNTFVAGEGGPTSIIVSGNYSIIQNGTVLLLRDSSCDNPQIAIHEILHVLGFEHSDNPKNIMYNYSNCNQEMGVDLINTINKIYSTPSYPDLVFDDVSFSSSGRYLSGEVSIRNVGLNKADSFKLEIYVAEKLIKTFDITTKLGYGEGVQIKMENVHMDRIDNAISLKINSSFAELDKENNFLNLEKK